MPMVHFHFPQKNKLDPNCTQVPGKKDTTSTATQERMAVATDYTRLNILELIVVTTPHLPILLPH